MSVRVVLFASLREELGRDQLDVAFPGEGRVSDLIRLLAKEEGEAWSEQLTAENVRVAINQSLVAGNEMVADGDEVAFFPPVTGG